MAELIQIDPRSHLEVADQYHRYAKNLRLYFKEYSRLFGVEAIIDDNCNLSLRDRFKPFFQWLDDTSSNRPELSACPRQVLDNDRVLYLRNDEEREPFLISVDEDGLLRRNTTKEIINTGSKGWIFVIRNWQIFACEKRTSAYPRFHHSSFFAGEPVQAAGMLVVEHGRLTKLFPHSGHYRPDDRQFAWLLKHLEDFTINLQDVKVDAQRVYKVSRQTIDGKAAKVETAYFVSGFSALNFLTVKRLAITSGLLAQIRCFDKRKLRTLAPPNAPSSSSAEAASEQHAESSDQLSPSWRHKSAWRHAPSNESPSIDKYSSSDAMSIEIARSYDGVDVLAIIAESPSLAVLESAMEQSKAIHGRKHFLASNDTDISVRQVSPYSPTSATQQPATSTLLHPPPLSPIATAASPVSSPSAPAASPPTAPPQAVVQVPSAAETALVASFTSPSATSSAHLTVHTSSSPTSSPLSTSSLSSAASIGGTSVKAAKSELRSPKGRKGISSFDLSVQCDALHSLFSSSSSSSAPVVL